MPTYSHGSVVESFSQVDPDSVTFALLDCLPNLSLDRELVPTVAEGHERASEWVTIQGSCNLDKASRAEEVGGSGHDDVCPTSLVGTLPKLRSESLIKLAHGIAPSRTDSVI